MMNKGVLTHKQHIMALISKDPKIVNNTAHNPATVERGARSEPSRQFFLGNRSRLKKTSSILILRDYMNFVKNLGAIVEI
jgi:phage anti-repressor protein